MKLEVVDNLSYVEDGNAYEIRLNIETLRLDYGQTGVSQSVKCRCWGKEGTNAAVAQSCYWAVYLRNGTTYTYKTRNTTLSNAERTLTVSGISTAYQAIAVYALSTSPGTGNTAPTSYIAKAEIPIVVNGEQGAQGEGYSIVTTPSQLMYDPNTSQFVGGSSITFQAMLNGANYTGAANSLLVWQVNSDGTSPSSPAGTGTSSVTISSASASYAAYKGELYVASVKVAVVYVPINRYGVNGINGTPGHVGRFYYYAGVFDGTPSHYSMEQTQAPYVKASNGIFYMLDNQGVEPTGGTMTASQEPTASGQTQWSVMSSEQQYYIAKAVFGEYAQFGSFIFNGDWMLSTKGTLSLGATAVGIYSTSNATADYITMFKTRGAGDYTIKFNLSMEYVSSSLYVIVSKVKTGNTSSTWTVRKSYTSAGEKSFSVTLEANTIYYILASRGSSTGIPAANISMPALTAPSNYLYFDTNYPAEKEYSLYIVNTIANSTKSMNAAPLSLKAGITYMFTFTISNYKDTGSGGSLDFYVMTYQGYNNLHSMTVARNGTFRTMFTPSSDVSVCCGTQTTANVTATVSCCAVTAMFFPQYAVDGRNGLTIQQDGIFKGSIDVTKMTMKGNDFITDLAPGYVKFTSIKNPLSWLSIGEDGEGMSLKMTDRKGILIWNISSNGIGRITQGTAGWEEVKLKFISTERSQVTVQSIWDLKEVECTTYYIYHGAWTEIGGSRIWENNDDLYDGTLHTSNVSKSENYVSDGWYAKPNHSIFEYAMSHGGQYGLPIIWVLDGKNSSEDNVLFNT